MINTSTTTVSSSIIFTINCTGYVRVKFNNSFPPETPFLLFSHFFKHYLLLSLADRAFCILGCYNQRFRRLRSAYPPMTGCLYFINKQLYFLMFLIPQQVLTSVGSRHDRQWSNVINQWCLNLSNVRFPTYFHNSLNIYIIMVGTELHHYEYGWSSYNICMAY